MCKMGFLFQMACFHAIVTCHKTMQRSVNAVLTVVFRPSSNGFAQRFYAGCSVVIAILDLEHLSFCEYLCRG